MPSRPATPADTAQPPAAVAPKQGAGSARLGREGRRALWQGLDQGSIMGVELMSAILTWAGLGWLADRWLGTGPWLLVVGALIGNAAGIYLIWLRSGRMDARDGDAAHAQHAAHADEPPGGTHAP